MLSRLFHSDTEVQQDLISQAHRIAALLGPPGGRVVLSCKHARSYVPGLLGAWLAGATVDLLPNVQAGTLDRVDADADVAYVLHDVSARQERSPKAIYVPDLLTATETTASPRANAFPEIAVRMTTSGTTERPRYVVKSMAQLLDELDVLATVIAPARCVLSTVPLSHLYGLLFGALLPLRMGARIVSHEALLPADVAAVIEREQVDLMISTPAHLRAMADAPMPRGLRVITSGARLPPELHMSVATGHGWQVTDVMGSTETGGIATRSHPMNAWVPLPGVRVSAPEGLLVVESPWCGAPRVELEDRVDIKPGGSFHYLGRTNELLKIAGKRAHAHELEATVRAVAGVTDAAVLAHAAAGKEARVVLAVCIADGAAVGREEITEAIRRQFDAVFVPRMIKIVPKIPRTERGKLDGEALRELFGITTATTTTSQIPLVRVGPGHYTAEVPDGLVFFQGHFDAFTIMPGAVIIERLVWPVVKAELPDVKALRGIRRLRFRRPVMPQQQLSVTLLRDKGRLTFEVTCAKTVVASGQLLVD
ncbi:MAG: AMP-binding protein [Deltaproteobacteria bacterium]|nr:AMP-binding protein [Deltaproteobacteria bacterium]